MAVQSEAALENALHALGRDWESVEIVLTHSHPDHTSNLDRIWRRWMRIYANMHSFQEVQNLMNIQSPVFNPLIGHLLRPDKVYGRSMQKRDANTYRVSAELLPLKNQPDLFYLADGDVYRNGSYRFQVITTPDVMITDKEMHLHSQIGQLGNLPQETSIAFRHYQFELVPKVEYISQQVHCCSIMFYTIQKIHQTALLCPPVCYGTRT